MGIIEQKTERKVVETLCWASINCTGNCYVIYQDSFVFIASIDQHLFFFNDGLSFAHRMTASILSNKRSLRLFFICLQTVLLIFANAHIVLSGLHPKPSYSSIKRNKKLTHTHKTSEHGRMLHARERHTVEATTDNWKKHKACDI